MSQRTRFTKVAAAGVTFQAGSAAVDSSTIMSALVYQLSGSSILVGAVTAILRFGWLFPQLIVGFFAQRSGTSMPFYVIGAFGRAVCMALLALVLFIGSDWPPVALTIVVMALWTAYAFISGIVAVPYNDIVARSVPSRLRSRLLATRFFGGGVLALGVAAIATRLFGRLEFPLSFAAVIAMASVLMLLSSTVFTTLGEPENAASKSEKLTFFKYLKDGIDVFKSDMQFRKFVFAQWCGGAVLMAMPFYVVQASNQGFDLSQIALLLGAQTAGALISNPLWGWWGDRRGKDKLLSLIAAARILPPLLVLLLIFIPMPGGSILLVYMGLFFFQGALANGLTIAVIGFLMEISPDDRRPAYSGYFNAMTAPAFLLPLIAGFFAAIFGLEIVFAISALAALTQFLILREIPPNK